MRNGARNGASPGSIRPGLLESTPVRCAALLWYKAGCFNTPQARAPLLTYGRAAVIARHSAHRCRAPAMPRRMCHTGTRRGDEEARGARSRVARLREVHLLEDRLLQELGEL